MTDTVVVLPRRRSRRLAALGVAAVLVAVGGTLVARHVLDGPGDGNPFAGRSLLVTPEPRLVAAAQQAAADGDQRRSTQLERLAVVPTGTWLLPEQHPTPADVGAYVTDVVQRAAGQDATAVLVVYAIPDRDCSGGLSSGGLAAEEYVPWVRAVASAAADEHAVVVLEPDALVSADQCGLADARTAQLGDAVAALADAGAATYVDAGHSAWRDADEVADLLEGVGVERVRGFSVNVANYQPTAVERQWAEQVSTAVGGAHFVVDTGRNGAAGGRVDEWCNPPGQALGSEPGAVTDATRLDALLWVKPPWESDGTCQGGPEAGQLWLERVVDLATAAGW